MSRTKQLSTVHNNAEMSTLIPLVPPYVEELFDHSMELLGTFAVRWSSYNYCTVLRLSSIISLEKNQDQRPKRAPGRLIPHSRREL